MGVPSITWSGCDRSRVKERPRVLSERRFDTGTVELNYGEGPPNGPPFVILHGGAGSWHYADDLIALLVARWHVYAPDFAGTGYRPRAGTLQPARLRRGHGRLPRRRGARAGRRLRALPRRRGRDHGGGDAAATPGRHPRRRPVLARRSPAQGRRGQPPSTSSTWPRTSSGIASPGGRRPRSRAPCGTCRCSCRGSRSRSERGTRSVRTTPGSSFKR